VSLADGSVRVLVRVDPEGRGLDLPRYQSDHAAGMDLLAAIGADLHLAPGERSLVSTGLALAIPPGYEGQVRPRSGLAVRAGVTLLNAPGTIDADYRGTLKVVLINHGSEPVTIRRGATIGGGSTIAAEAPAEMLTVARARQVSVQGWKRPVKKPKAPKG